MREEEQTDSMLVKLTGYQINLSLE